MNVRSVFSARAYGAALLAVGLVIPSVSAQTITRGSLGFGGNQLSGSMTPAISGNGRYLAFNTVNQTSAWYLTRRDLGNGDVVPLNVNNQSPANATMHGGSASMSGDGRYVAFVSEEPMVNEDSNNAHDIYLRDVVGMRTTRISVSSDGTEANRESNTPSISANGRYVAFWSRASNLVPDDHNNSADIFVHDRITGTTERVSVASGGAEGHGDAGSCTINADGRYVAFSSSAPDLVEDDDNNAMDVFVHDRKTGVTERVSVTSDGVEAHGMSGQCTINGDGRYVAFASNARDLVAQDKNGTWDVFVHDRATRETRLVSVAEDGTQGDSLSQYPSISGGGRFIAFSSYATTLAAGGTAGTPNDYVRDMVLGKLARVSVSDTSPPIDGATFSSVPKISADGRFLAFDSAAPLVRSDTNNASDIYVYGPLTTLAPSITLAAGATVNSSPTALDGVVYFGDDAGRLHAVNTTTGAEVSGFPVDIGAAVGAAVQIGSRPAVYYSTAGKFIYLTTTRGDICRVSMDGSSVAHYSGALGAGNMSTPAVSGGGKVYVGLTTPTFSCVVKLNADMSLDAVSGAIAGADSTISSVSVRGNKVYVGLTQGVTGDIVVLNTQDLTPLSAGVAVGEGVTSPPYVAGKYMYIGTLAGNFYRLNAATSSVDASFGEDGKVAVGEPLPTSPFFNNDAFYAGSSRGKVWRIGEDGSLSVAYDTWEPAAVVQGVVVERASNTLAFGTSAGVFYKVPLNGGDADISGPNPGFRTTPGYDASTGRFFIGSDDGNVYGF